MQEQTLADLTKALSIEELKQFGKETGPCVTIIAPSHVPGGNSKKLTTRLRAMTTEAERKLAERGYDPDTARIVTEPILKQVGQINDEGDAKGESYILFASPGECRSYWVPQPLNECVALGDNFFIRSLLPMLGRDKDFYILAVAQKHSRLLKCTEFTSEEIPLPKETPDNLRDHTQTRKPDHVMDNRQSPGPSSGSSPGVMFGTNTDKEDRDEYLVHWFKDLSRGVCDAIREKDGNTDAPLILCCVEYEQPIFRDVCDYANLLEDGVIGAPDSFKGGELHKRALDALHRHDQAKVDEALKKWDKQTGEYAKAGVKDIVKAAYEGRVLSLFISETANVQGSFNEATFTAEGSDGLRPWDEDLANAAALQTILHGGHVYVVPQSKIPENRPLAAIMRY